MPAAKLFDGLLPKSRMALNMALAMRDTTGMEGWIVIYIPPEDRAPCEVMTTTHGWQMTLEPERFDPRRKR